MACGCSGGATGEFLLTAGTALAIQIAHSLSVDEIELLAAFLEVLGDQLGLLALKMPQNTGPCCQRAQTQCPPTQSCTKAPSGH